MKGKNIIGNTIHNFTKVLQDIDAKYNLGNDKKIVKIYKNNETSGSYGLEYLPPYQEQHTRLYIGKILKDEPTKGMYNEDFLRAAFYTLLKYSKNHDIHLVIAPIVSKICNGDTEEILSDNETIEYIQNEVIRKYYSNTGKKIHITALQNQDNQKELFKFLETTGSEIMQQKISKSTLNGNDSLSIFLYLLYCIQQDNKLEEAIKKIKPSKVESSLGDLYAIVEIACRLSDYFHGITNQRGAGKQVDYDDIIANLINPQSQKFQKTLLSEQIDIEHHPFFRVNLQHLHAEKYNKNLDTTVQKANIHIKKIKNILLGVLGGAVIGGGAITGIQHLTKYKKEKEKEEIFIQNIEQEYNNHSVINGKSLLHMWDLSNTLKQEYGIKYILQNTYNIEDTEKYKYDFLKWILKQQKEGNFYFANQHSPYGSHSHGDLVEMYLLDRHELISNIEQIDIRSLQEQYADYEDGFYNTAKFKGNKNTIEIDDYYYSTGIEFLYFDREGFKWECKYIKSKGIPYVLFKDKVSGQYEINPYLAHEFFTPFNNRQNAEKIDNYLDAKSKSVTGIRKTQELLCDLRMEGYQIDLSNIPVKYTDYTNESEKLKYIAYTYCKNSLEKDAVEDNYDLDLLIKNNIDTLIQILNHIKTSNQEIIYPKSHTYNLLYSILFDILVEDLTKNNGSISNHSSIFKNGKILEKMASHKLLHNNYDIESLLLMLKKHGNFEGIQTPQNGIIGTNYSINTQGKIYKNITHYGFEQKGDYKLKNGLELTYGYQSPGKPGDSDGKFVAYIKKNKHSNNIINKLINDYCIKYYINCNKYPFSKEDEKEIKNSYNLYKEILPGSQASNIFKARKNIKNHLYSIFYSPNTYFGYLMWCDILEKEYDEQQNPPVPSIPM